ncbi:hypothetical protein P7C71_g1820, partial [Lecanoromycetidae sp. Uapishka_2]
MHITSIPMWTGSSNNYAYLVKDDKTNDAVIIDPANPPDHWDHAGGNKNMLSQFKDLPVIGGKDCESVTKTPGHDSTFKIGSGITVKALHTPCHTQDSICWFMEDGDERVVFTGDTLFIGEPVKKLESFAENNQQTQGKFTIGDEKVSGECLAPFYDEANFGQEYNVFMRLNDPTIQKATGKTNDVDVMGALREMKNNM